MIFFKKTTSPGFLLIVGLLFTCGACRKANHFKEELLSLPQLEINDKFAYNPSYSPGDTMAVNGMLNNNEDLIIRVGDANADIISHSRFYYKHSDIGDSILADRVIFIITSKMGSGRKIPVSITCKGVTLSGPSIAIMPKTGPGSLDHLLKVVHYAELPPDAIFLPLVNGKGSIYYYSQKKIYKLIDGITTAIMTEGDLHDDTVTFSMNQFLGGGINPQETAIYFSVQSDSNDMRLCRFDIQSRALTVLNTTYVTAYDYNNPGKDYYKVKPPFEGKVQNLKFIVRNIFPDSKGNVYLTLVPAPNLAGEPYAVAKLDMNGNITYLFSRADFQSLPEANGPVSVPGTKLENTVSFSAVACLPDEQRLYVYHNPPGYIPGTPGPLGGYDMYDLENKIRLAGFTTNTDQNDPPQILGPFEALHYMVQIPETAFGFMPYPGEKMIALLYPVLSGAQEHKPLSAWTVLDIGDQRNYEYAPGPFDQNGYFFEKTDKLLNYDSKGNLYMTASSYSMIVKTEKK